jgi:hypothetical protein
LNVPFTIVGYVQFTPRFSLVTPKHLYTGATPVAGVILTFLSLISQVAPSGQMIDETTLPVEWPVILVMLTLVMFATGVP